jgi:inositol phosphorylceramide mannosyltransferase catalytic subunit
MEIKSHMAALSCEEVRSSGECNLIPRRIIQTGPPNLPLIFRAAVQNVTLLHPTFEYRFFNDADVQSFIHQYFPEYKQVFEHFRFPIQKYDFFRYLAIYQMGGFYLDLDVFLVKNLTSLLSSRCVFPFEEPSGIQYLWDHFGLDWQIGNYAFGSTAGHPFLAAIIENCVRAQSDPSWVRPMMKGIPALFHKEFYVLNTTGPGMVSRTFAENPGLARELNILFPEDVRDRASWHQFGDFGVHQMEGSWRGPQKFLSLRLLHLWDAWTLHRVLRRARNRGKTRDLRQKLCEATD